MWDRIVDAMWEWMWNGSGGLFVIAFVIAFYLARIASNTAKNK